jgi:hypothetical protein
MIYICRIVGNDGSDRSDMSNNETAIWDGPRSLGELEQPSPITGRKGELTVPAAEIAAQYSTQSNAFGKMMSSHK